MKKLFCLLLITAFVLSLSACGKKKTSQSTKETQVSGNTQSSTVVDEVQIPNSKQQVSDGFDVDLTKLSSTMVYSEVYNMMYSPDDYIGKTVKMKGRFSYYEDPDTKVQYFACIIADATACCSQGLEFTLTGEHTYPIDYPEVGSEIIVTGTFESYEENGLQYCRLTNAAILS